MKPQHTRRILLHVLPSLCCLAAVLTICHSASAALVPISPITATGSASLPGVDRNVDATVGGFSFTTGLSVGTGAADPDTGLVFPQHTMSPDNPGDPPCCAPPLQPANMWLGIGSNVNITWDLGSVATLDRMWVYNYNEFNLTIRGSQSTGDVSTSIDGVGFTPLAVASNVALAQAPGADDYDTPDVIDLDLTSARYVRFENLTHFPGAANTGLSEVVFFEETVVPPVPVSVVNGSFEDPAWTTVPDPNFSYPDAPAGWTATTGFSARYHAGTGYVDPTDGDAAFSLEGNPINVATGTGLYQDLGTMQTGETYTLFADVLGETSWPSSYRISFVKVTDGAELAAITEGDFPVAKKGNPGDSVAVTMDYTARASDAGHALRVLIETPQNVGYLRTGVDNVHVTVVPEPSTLILALLGIVALAGVRIRRRN